MSEDKKDNSTLSELFENAFKLFNNINKTDEPTNAPKVQSDIKKAMNMFENLTRFVSVVDMFSENETVDEIATEHLKYLLLPALLGTLITKICGTNDRMHLIKVAEIYFVDFLKRLKAYGITDINIPEEKSEQENGSSNARVKSNAEMITEMVSCRNTKLQRYQEQKELESRLDTLQKNLDNPNIDDETKREYFMALLKLYVIQTIDELSSIAAEKPILEYMQKMGPSETMTNRSSQKFKSSASKLQPIIITRNELQKKVYGAGYPSLPVLTVQEFYDQRVKEGDWPDQSQRNQINSKCLQDIASSDDNENTQEDIENIEKEEKIEQDDPELLERTRAMDEYKDTHHRGWGNRANRS
ncbi:PREDICTED: immunoglobulin-binding protein 1b [Polistes dominula]|uniref:Immunoglobulin-binding protein 1b n=1 Tax=Polistes dominula TaxID=743375 RepID=A0ABM1IL17_POLDO|nr:PREDICTED: immunoglobulin-binding protein 1b [Polistes dominula]